MKESSQQREREREREREEILVYYPKSIAHIMSKIMVVKNYGNGCQRCQMIELITRELILNY